MALSQKALWKQDIRYVNATAGNPGQNSFSSASSSLPSPAAPVSPLNTGAGKPGVQYCCFRLEGHLDNQLIDFS